MVRVVANAGTRNTETVSMRHAYQGGSRETGVKYHVYSTVQTPVLAVIQQRELFATVHGLFLNCKRTRR